MRGAGGDLAICEEFAFMDPQFFFKVVVPTLLTGAAFVGITTLGEETNFVNRLITLRHPDGRLVYRVIALELVCERCRRLDLAESCRHRLGELPYWHDVSKHADVEKIMSECVGDFLRETKGMQATSNSKPVFNERAITRLLNARRETHADSISHFFISIDPAAGGMHSEFAIVSCIYTRSSVGGQSLTSNCLIVGAEATSGRDPKENVDVVLAHIAEAERRIPELASAIKVIIIESNLGNEAAHMQLYLESRRVLGPNCCMMFEDKDGGVGVRMSENMKSMLAMSMDFRLNECKIAFHERFFSCASKKLYKTAGAIRDALIFELLNFTRVLIPSKDPFGKPKELLSGKMGYGKDDLAIALMWNCAMATRFFNNKDAYGPWLRRV